ncbi:MULTISPECIES: DUF2750 domain-containing protein [Bacillus]|uniref:DUF2750 domain-containing protein n=1 Tax=Bacillus TaxID=1386 RepID=UPI00042201F7|nr:MULTISPECIES: DUF2750 domain-containing protein [Bacillus]KFM84836.1 hypothetical protein DJ88_170 [Bacillus paralicheniformis]MCB6218248.1 DUF2750 domain-containing protein [Bacillus paralicheniformis]MEC2169038.1 DUF2750 domain-containing protein [Bacillus paralicheniformis]MED1219727.1 DUF2750 domain-containing protein [Bacillus paralicheniformis]TWJ49897.1 hypothetical protein CHCC5022_3217 [Bacillus paralicheniformis]
MELSKHEKLNLEIPEFSSVHIKEIIRFQYYKEFHEGKDISSIDMTVLYEDENDSYHIDLTFKEVSSVRLTDFEGRHGGFKIDQLNAGWENINYVVEDYEDGTFQFYCHTYDVSRIERIVPRLNKKEVEALLKASKEKRYEYFIKRIADFEEVWSLYGDGWVMTEDDQGGKLIPFWPAKDYAELCAEQEWRECTARPIDLEEFVNEWLPGMKEDGIQPSIFFNSKDAITLPVDILLEDILAELENY